MRFFDYLTVGIHITLTCLCFAQFFINRTLFKQIAFLRHANLVLSGMAAHVALEKYVKASAPDEAENLES